jgi:hypothetical protein
VALAAAERASLQPISGRSHEMAIGLQRQVELIILGEENDDAVDKLAQLLRTADRDPTFQLKLLCVISKHQPHFFNTILRWGQERNDNQDIDDRHDDEKDNDSSDDEVDNLLDDDGVTIILGLLVQVFKKDKDQPQNQERPTDAGGEQTAGKPPVPAVDSAKHGENDTAIGKELNPNCVLVAKILERMLGVLKTGKMNNENILHLVCRHGTAEMARFIVTAMEQRFPEDLEDLLQAQNKNRETPLKTALYVDDPDLIDLFAGFEDGKRQDHILEAAKTGKLAQLKTLLQSYQKLQSHDGDESRHTSDVNEKLLVHGVFQAAAEAGNVEIWKFLTTERPKATEDASLLQTAIAHHQKEIVRLILEQRPLLLQDLEAARCTAEIVTDRTVKLKSKVKESEDALNELGNENDKTSDKKASARKKIARRLILHRKQQVVAEDIEGMVLENVVRVLKPRDVKSCWPTETGSFSFP